VRRKHSTGKRRSPMQGLRARLEDAEAVLHAIGAGDVDAVVVSGPRGERTLAIEGATHPYHVLLNAMSDGAALLAPDGTILFANRRLGEIAGAPRERLHGSRMQQLVARGERAGFEEFLREGGQPRAREFSPFGGAAATTPVWIALSTVPLEFPKGEAETPPPGAASVLMAVITDLTERKRAEATRLELTKRLISAEDEERRRIARELHDETGQSLTALLVGLKVIEEQAVTLDVRATAQRLRAVAARTVDDVGRLARGLHPSVLDDLGLVAAAQRQVADFTASYGVAAEFRGEGIGARRLPPLVQTTAFRILQEALTNVARHARARAAGVELKLEETALELVVRDDGVGFDAGRTLRDAPGLGLHGMRERVALLGGSVEIESSPGHGTVVRARTPPSPPPPPENSPGARSAMSAQRKIRHRAPH
jgi:signal transduction histidine kinase